MEIPNEIKSLYRHWDFHTVEKKGDSAADKIPEELVWFIQERINIWKKKTSGDPKPYTKDMVLGQYRFCNIFREFDRQTIEFHTILNPLRDNFSLWLLNIFYCRMVARTETIKHVGLLSFDQRENKRFYKKLISSPRPRFGIPYVFPISVIQKSNTPTRELFVAHYLPKVMPVIAREIKSWKKVSVYAGVSRVLPIFGFNLLFLWTEVLIDVAYQFPQYIDLFKRFPIGPGSLPTLQNLTQAKDDPSLFVEMLGMARTTTDITYKGHSLALSAENWEGIGCEFRKYNNLKQGRGRKRLYR